MSGPGCDRAGDPGRDVAEACERRGRQRGKQTVRDMVRSLAVIAVVARRDLPLRPARRRQGPGQARRLPGGAAHGRRAAAYPVAGPGGPARRRGGPTSVRYERPTEGRRLAPGLPRPGRRVRGGRAVDATPAEVHRGGHARARSADDGRRRRVGGRSGTATRATKYDALVREDDRAATTVVAGHRLRRAADGHGRGR